MLATRRFEWEDTETGEISVTKESWRDAWMIAGIHSYHWAWVRKYGKMPCGCTRNPVTRRRVLIAGECEEHGISRLRR